MHHIHKTEHIRGDIYLVLDNIRSIHNVGSIFRTAACAGVKEIFLCGYTPSPIDRFGRLRKDFKKVSLGGEEEVRYHHVRNTEEALEILRKQGVYIVALEQAEQATPIDTFKPTYPVAYVLGNEVEGVSSHILECVDQIVEIPLRGCIKESLNVSVVAGIMLF